MGVATVLAALALLVFVVVSLCGCQTVREICTVLEPVAATPVCDRDSVGVRWNDCQCMKFSDGSYQWLKEPK